MASRKDVIIGLVIGGVFLSGLALFAALFFFALTDDDEFVESGGGQIAVVEVFGPIYNSATAVRQLEKWSQRGDIEAIILHINSPGGGVAASHEIYEAVNRAREEEGKIVVASFGSVAASGGYYIACAADYVVTNPGALTGSIGVIMQYTTFGDLMEKIGINMETVKSGELKDVGNPSREMTGAEEQMLRSVIMDTYEQFVEVVARGRGMEKEAVYPLADGRIYTGLQAFNLGLVDTLGTFHQAVMIAADMAGISGEPETIKEVPKKPDFFDLLTQTLTTIDDKISSRSRGPQLLYLYQ
ncbi:MAG: signal peptide peptidase SppA [Candidatus Zixiibacteriota bacterium]